MAHGLIIKSISGDYTVIENDTKELYVCRARGNFRNKMITPLVGDRVEFSKQDENRGYILKIDERDNFLVRPPIANVDQVLLVFSVKEPDFNQILLDRFLAILEALDLRIVIILTKMDLLNDEDFKEIDAYAEYYQSIGYDVIETSSKRKENIDDVVEQFNHHISVLAGQSGVGKSSLLNAIDPDFNLKTDEISHALGRGKHTTRHVELHRLNDGLIADTPGFGNLEFDEDALDLLHYQFIDFAELSNDCKFRGCVHINEPKCAVKAKLGENPIYDQRYDHYVKFYQELKDRKPTYGRKDR